MFFLFFVQRASARQTLAFPASSSAWRLTPGVTRVKRSALDAQCGPGADPDALVLLTAPGDDQSLPTLAFNGTRKTR